MPLRWAECVGETWERACASCGYPSGIRSTCFYSTFTALREHYIRDWKLRPAQTAAHKNDSERFGNCVTSNRNFEASSFEWPTLTNEKSPELEFFLSRKTMFPLHGRLTHFCESEIPKVDIWDPKSWKVIIPEIDLCRTSMVCHYGSAWL